MALRPAERYPRAGWVRAGGDCRPQGCSGESRGPANVMQGNSMLEVSWSQVPKDAMKTPGRILPGSGTYACSRLLTAQHIHGQSCSQQSCHSYVIDTVVDTDTCACTATSTDTANAAEPRCCC
jgi:hypothetical protein